MSNVEAAERTARAIERADMAVSARPAPSRWFAVGDPQTTAHRFFSVLDRYGALGADGLLAAGTGLISMGDHFDFSMGAPEAEPAGREILAWLVAQEGSTHILAGNHDVARVAELAFETDETFAAARRDAVVLRDRHRAGEDVHLLVEAFFERFPHVPSPEMVLKDFASFSVAQRRHVQRALLTKRMRLALVATVHGTPVLLTHAGVTRRELRLLDVPAEPHAIAAALERRFDEAVERVAAAWRNGDDAALALEPIHVAGRSRKEGGGLLYHRPARRDRDGADPEWELAAESPRRFDPRDMPAGLVQMIGHSGHARTARDLPGFVVEGSERDGIALRTLSVTADGDVVRYEAGVLPPAPGAATAYMVDPGFAHEPLERVEICAVDGLATSRLPGSPW